MRNLRYAPGTIPVEDPYQAAVALAEEVQRIAEVLDVMQAGYGLVYYAEPPAPETGMVVFADGTEWNPGSGEGKYEYRSDGMWYKL